MKASMWAALGLSLSLLPGLSQALVVAPNPEILSALGQPLHARLKLTDLSDLSSDDIHAKLGSDEDLKQMGLGSSAYYPADMHFAVVINPGGDSYIDITTTQPVNEPQLDFAVRISWPNNDRLSELSIMLDPPVGQGKK